MYLFQNLDYVGDIWKLILDYRSWEQLKELDIGIHFFNLCECLIYDCDLNVITNKKWPKL